MWDICLCFMLPLSLCVCGLLFRSSLSAVKNLIELHRPKAREHPSEMWGETAAGKSSVVPRSLPFVSAWSIPCRWGAQTNALGEIRTQRAARCSIYIGGSRVNECMCAFTKGTWIAAGCANELAATAMGQKIRKRCTGLSTSKIIRLKQKAFGFID